VLSSLFAMLWNWKSTTFLPVSDCAGRLSQLNRRTRIRFPEVRRSMQRHADIDQHALTLSSSVGRTHVELVLLISTLSYYAYLLAMCASLLEFVSTARQITF
jgi:hypothetical protein